jgi:hypothetical protein
MSSENRSITLNTLDSDVPPLNTKNGANSDCANNKLNSHDTQKSFSRITALRCKVSAALSNASLRSSTDMAVNLLLTAELPHENGHASTPVPRLYLATT